MAGFVQKLKQKWLPQYHREFFRWHCQQFFPWERHLLPSEQAYLDVCFQLAEDYTHESTSTPAQDSYYSYSHRVKNTEVNSARLMYGSGRPSPLLWQAATAVLEQRRLVLPSTLVQQNQIVAPEFLSFAALGWDMQENHCKVYFRIHATYATKMPIWQTCWQGDLGHIRDVVLGVWIFRGTQLEDERLCVFPVTSDTQEVPLGRVLMLSSHRGMITAYDRVNVQVWASRLNPQGQRILQTYRKYSAISGSISAHHANDFTLIVP